MSERQRLVAAEPRSDLEALRGRVPEAVLRRVAAEAREVLGGRDATMALVRRLVAQEGAASGRQGGARVGTDRTHPEAIARAALTRTLIDSLAPLLGFRASDVVVREDDQARRRLDGVGARGLFESGTVFLHPDHYSPERPEGRALLAHELTHVAQAALATRGRAGSGAAVETEARLVAAEFGVGRSPSRPMVGLPTHHLAAEGGSPLGAEIQTLKAQLEAQVAPIQADLDQKKANTPPKPEGTFATPVESADEKIRNYSRGVDGTADQIEDLSAFDDLCQGFDDKDTALQTTAMNQIRRSEPYKLLCDQWQSALDGGGQKSQMKSLFEGQFNNRGFWGSTESAFNKVRNECKGDAKRNKDVAQAMKDAEAAKALQPPAVVPSGAPGGAPPGAPGAPDQAPPAAAKAKPLSKAALESVPEKAPELATFKQAEAAHGRSQNPKAMFALITGETGHYNEHVGAIKNGAAEGQGRSGQIWGEVFKGLLAGGTKGVLEQGFDTLVLDSLGTFGDLGLKAVTKGRFGGKVPVVGPMIQLFQSGLVGDILRRDGNSQFLKTAGDGFGKVGSNFVAGYENGGRAWSSLKSGNVLDSVGYMAATVADFITGLAELVDTIAMILGTVSAICYIAGALLIVLGAIFSWCGLAVLIPPGGWLVKAGTLLGKIVTALGPIGIALRGLALGFRVIAAYMVPAADYAQQLQGAGSNASAFGEKAGAKIADKTVGDAKKALGEKIVGNKKTTPPAADAAAVQGEGEGAAKGQELAAKLKDTDAEAAKLSEDARTKKAEVDAEVAARNKREADAEATQRAKDDAARDDGNAPARAAKTSAFSKALNYAGTVMNDTFNAIDAGKSAIDAIGDLKKMTTNRQAAGEAAYEVTNDVLKEFVAKKREKLARLEAGLAKAEQALIDAGERAKSAGDKLTKAHEQLAKKQTELGETPADSPDRQRLANELRALQQRAAEASSQMQEATKVMADARAEHADDAQELKKMSGRQAELEKRGTALNQDTQNQMQTTDAVAGVDSGHARAKEKREAQEAQQAAQAKKGKAISDHSAAQKALTDAHADVTRKKTALDDATRQKSEAETAARQLAEDAKKATASAKESERLAEAQREAASNLREKQRKAAEDAARLTNDQADLEGRAAKIREKVTASEEAETALSGAKAEQQKANQSAEAATQQAGEARQEAANAKKQEKSSRSLMKVFQGRDIEVRSAVGDGSVSEARFVRVVDNGVMVSEGGKNRVVPWDQIVGPPVLTGSAAKIVKAQADQQTALQKAGELDKTAQDATADAANSATQIAAHEKTLRDLPAEKRASESALADSFTQQAQGSVAEALARAKKVADTPIQESVEAHQSQAQVLSGQAGEMTSLASEKTAAAGQKQKEIEGLATDIAAAELAHTQAKDKVTAAQTTLQTAASAVGTATTAEAQATQTVQTVSDSHAPVEDAQELRGTLGNANQDAGGARGVLGRGLTNPSSGNAMGGVGSAYQEFLTNLLDGDLGMSWDHILDPAAYQAKVKENVEKDAAKENPGLAQARANLEGGSPEAQKAWTDQASALWEARGKGPATWITNQIGGPLMADLLIEAPPKDPLEMGATFDAADQAMKASIEEHGHAFRSYGREQVIDQLILSEKDLDSKVGVLVEEDAKAKKEQATRGKKKEKERKSKAAQQKKAQKAEQDKSLMGGAAEKVMKYSKYMSTSPDSGTMKGAGSASGKGLDDAHSQSGEAKEATENSSDRQATFLEGLEASGDNIVAFTKKNRDALQAKIAADEAGRDEIRRKKGEHLIASRGKRDEAELNSLKFLVDLNEMTIWADKYRTKRLAATGA